MKTVQALFLIPVIATCSAAAQDIAQLVLKDAAGANTWQPSASVTPYAALHYFPDNCAECPPFAADYLKRGVEIAGITHVFVTPNGTIPNEWKSTLGENAPPVYADPEGKLEAALNWNPSLAPRIALITREGEILLNESAMTYDAFAAKAIEATKSPSLSEYLLNKDGLAIEGYDPVAYYEQQKPSKGKDAYESIYQGVRYRFASDDNRAKFAANPEAFAPTYGGWCATAMADGKKVEIDPKSYKITGGRLFLFYKGLLSNAKKDWDKKEPELTRKADAEWSKIVRK